VTVGKGVGDDFFEWVGRRRGTVFKGGMDGRRGERRVGAGFSYRQQTGCGDYIGRVWAVVSGLV